MPTLEQIFAACQADRAADWYVIPAGEPGTDLLAGVFETRNSSSPAVTALSHEYRAVYGPDPQIGIGWGMESEDWQQSVDVAHSAGVSANPDWMAPEWSDAFAQWAHLLLNGAMVWRVRYAYINRGAGADGYLPWPSAIRDTVPGDAGGFATRRVGWRTSRWELEFAALLNVLQGNTWDFDIDEARRFGMDVRDVLPFNDV